MKELSQALREINLLMVNLDLDDPVSVAGTVEVVKRVLRKAGVSTEGTD